MALLNFLTRRKTQSEPQDTRVPSFQTWSMEVMPRTAAKVDDFKAILPRGTRIYIAHIAGTSTDDMVATARRIVDDGFTAMPHFPARNIPDKTALEELIKRYRNEAGVTDALLLGGGETRPVGSLTSSIDMIETGLFDRHGFTRLHVAGHPEGNRDIDKDGSTRQVDVALKWKNDFSERTDAAMAIVTQFGFDPVRILEWAERIQNAGITLPIHVGIAGPAKLQTLIRFAISCGVGPSLKILQKRASDVTRLLMPYEPTEFVSAISHYKAQNPSSLIEQVHLFPLGGIQTGIDWMNRNITNQQQQRSA